MGKVRSKQISVTFNVCFAPPSKEEIQKAQILKPNSEYLNQVNILMIKDSKKWH